ncbi:MAG: ribosome recycling factor [Gemmatimonadetes bacterium]|nr:ribosome recycling factor [Gemmatimonadota bacterium]NIR79584.1 ribosome recycling factor [Gemmatimonadota bacterium]NIT88275.1 ribosome recycling factor [Gemmatimonadota bacterium]NIU32073.1 ribosome recycling factor [Gemmatimonadota bacterium]NIU36673.1 ribosome recycling factor [Gemmatimonadota bacterium]
MPTLKDAKKRMEDALAAVRREFTTVRTGKASPSLLDTVRVEAYGSQMPLNQVANVSSPDQTLLVVQPYDKNLLEPIEKAIMTADLGLNPSNDGNLIRVPIPPLNEERRKEYVRLLHKMAEEGRISVRHARRDAKQEIERRMKEHEIGEDDAHRQLNQLEEMTKEQIGKIEELLEKKEKEVMQV